MGRSKFGLVGAALIGSLLALGAPACSDEDVAAGPPNPDGKAAGAVCKENSECQSLACKDGKCTAVTGGNPTDSKRNGDETDVDCGGTSAPKCADLKSCKIADDCANGVCAEGKCAAPGPDDGVKNGDETDVDCGGAQAPRCAVGKGCAKHDDCASDACGYAKKCVDYRSCTGHFGGDTCGAGDTGDPSAQHESCCATVESGGVKIGKYQVTAGRMRAFVERYDGNLKSWATSAQPKGWNASWTGELPASIDDALVALGPNRKRGCNVADRGGRTYWQPAINGDEEEVSDFTKDVLDEKALNCVSWYMAQALCHFDGGRLASHREVMAQVTNGGSTSFPWGNTPRFSFPRNPLDQLVHYYSYQTPNPPDTLRTVGDDPLDQSFFMAPPGRRPLGANKAGVQDAMGNMMPWVNDGVRRFAWTASWEQSHNLRGEMGTWPPSGSSDSPLDGYWAIGARCVFPD